MDNMEKTFEHQLKGRWQKRKQKREKKAKTQQSWVQTNDLGQDFEELWKNERKALEHEVNALKQKEDAIVKSANVFRRIGNEREAKENIYYLDLIRSVEEWQRIADEWKCEAQSWERLRIAWRNMDADQVDPAFTFPNQVGYSDEDILETAYQVACEDGTTTSFRGKLDIIGHTDVGKTSLSRRLLGQPFLERTECTEGISTHHVKSRFNKFNLTTEAWIEEQSEQSDVLAKFLDEVLSKHEDLSKQSYDETTVIEEEEEKMISSSGHVEHLDSGKPVVVIKPEVSIPIQDRNTKDSTPETENLHHLLQPILEENQEYVEMAKNLPLEEQKTSDGEYLQEEYTIEASRHYKKRMTSKVRQQLLGQQEARLFTNLSSNVDYSLRLWDYGGHTEFLATHHLFLNIESATLILLDISKPMNHPIQRDQYKPSGVGIPSTPEQFLHYWLHTIHSQSLEKKLEPNIALVLTHKDMIHAVDKGKYIKQYILGVRKSIKGKAYSHYITKNNIFVVDNKNGHENDFVRLRSEVFKMITKQRSWKIERPVRWLKLEADILYKTDQALEKYLNMEEVKKMAKLLGIYGTELNSFLNFHHTLGDFVYYPEPDLKDILITDPQWLADLFKSLITSHDFIAQRRLKTSVTKQLKQATLSRESLKCLWKESPLDFLIELFQSFNLLLPSGAETEPCFIVPCMLPPDQRDMYETEPFKSMILTYNSEHTTKSGDVLPVGSFHKVLSECSKKWRICSGDHLSYTDASFLVRENIRLALTLLCKGSKVRASIWYTRNSTDHDTLDFVLETGDILEKIFAKFHIAACETFLIMCPHLTSSDKDDCLVRVKKELNITGVPKLSVTDRKCTFHKREVSETQFATYKSDNYGAKSCVSQEKLDRSTLKNLSLGITGNMYIRETWGVCPITMVKNRVRYCGTVSHGAPRILQPVDSEVSLQIPAGSKGVYRMSVQLDHFKYHEVVSKEECFISPVIKVIHQSLSDNKEDENPGTHVLNIPHCIRDRSLLKLIRVKKGDIDHSIPFHEIPLKDECDPEETSFFVDDTDVRVSCNSFSEFVCTTCKTTCQSTIRAFIFANLHAWPRRNVTTLQIKSFLCSYLFHIEDFRQTLIRAQTLYKLLPTTERDVDIDLEDFTPWQSSANIKLYAANTEDNQWKPKVDHDPFWKEHDQCFIQVKALSRLMTVDGCHLCRNPEPKEAMVVDMMTEGIVTDYHGVEEMIIQSQAQGTVQAVIPFEVQNEAIDGVGPEKQDRNYMQQRPNKTLKHNSRNGSQALLEDRSLTDSDLFKLAGKLSREQDIYGLGFQLGLQHSEIQSSIKNNKDDVTMAAYHMLHTWSTQQQNRKKAFTRLVTALEGAKFQSIIDDILYGN